MIALHIILAGVFASLSLYCYRSQRKLRELWDERQSKERGQVVQCHAGWVDLGIPENYREYQKTTKMIFVSIVLMSILKLGFLALAVMSLTRLFLR